MQITALTSPVPLPSRPSQATAGSALDALARLEDYARRPVPEPTAPAIGLPVSQPSLQWGDLGSVLALAATDVEENSRTGAAAEFFDQSVRGEITGLQQRQMAVEGTPCMNRPVHRRQLFAGGAEVHWNPELKQRFAFFGSDRMEGLIRFSDASNEPDPDGDSMYGMALSLIGQDGKASDILLTGGSERTEVSQARDAEAQMALFNMINHPNKLAGLGRILWDVGPFSGVKMLMDVKKMRTRLESVSALTAWSRAPFALKGRDGKEYLVKLRAVPTVESQPLTSQGQTRSDRLADEMGRRARQGDTRWSLELQFMQPGDDPYDARETWAGPWVVAGEVVVPRQDDQRLRDLAEGTRFSVWKNKETTSQAVDREVLRPWGELQRARQAAYRMAGSNRNCPYLQQMASKKP